VSGVTKWPKVVRVDMIHPPPVSVAIGNFWSATGPQSAPPENQPTMKKLRSLPPVARIQGGILYVCCVAVFLIYAICHCVHVLSGARVIPPP